MSNKLNKALFASALIFLGIASQGIAQSDEFKKNMDAYLKSDAGIQKIMDSMNAFAQKKQIEEEAAKNKIEQESFAKFYSQGNSPVKGPKKAKVTIVEISDFQCPYCVRGKDTMDQILKAYPKDVKLVFKNLPLGFHKEAKPAAIAALAAGEQGKFWEMHDLLFANQKDLSEAKYLEFAQQLKLNMSKFEKALKNEKLAKQVDADAEMAGKLGIQGTPGFFVNGIPVKGAYPFDYFKNLIDQELKK